MEHYLNFNDFTVKILPAIDKRSLLTEISRKIFKGTDSGLQFLGSRTHLRSKNPPGVIFDVLQDVPNFFIKVHSLVG